MEILSGINYFIWKTYHWKNERIISIKSFSFQEDETADTIQEWLNKNNIKTERQVNNVIACNKFFDPKKPSILLNSHHDTVEPNSGYTIDPHSPIIEDDKLYGLGSNDAGGALCSLISTFSYFYDKDDLNFLNNSLTIEN